MRILSEDSAREVVEKTVSGYCEALSLVKPRIRVGGTASSLHAEDTGSKPLEDV